ncbi:protein of unknown function [Streptomyces murinus]
MTTTRAPSLAATSATARPIPRPAPVTAMTLPAKKFPTPGPFPRFLTVR